MESPRNLLDRHAVLEAFKLIRGKRADAESRPEQRPGHGSDRVDIPAE